MQDVKPIELRQGCYVIVDQWHHVTDIDGKTVTPDCYYTRLIVGNIAALENEITIWYVPLNKQTADFCVHTR